MFEQLSQYQDAAWLILRLAVAVIFIYHALPKLAKPAAMAQGVGMPSGAIALLGMVELASSIAMILGVYIQLAAILLSVVMLGAIYFKKFKWGVPFAALDKTGWEFDFILLAANIAVMLSGGGSMKLF